MERELKLNTAGLNRLAYESSEFDTNVRKETSKSKLRGYQRGSDQFVRNLYNKEAGVLKDENNVDPFDGTPSANKTSKLNLFKLSNAKYQTSLLEGILKNQTNTAFNESVLTYQSKVLEYLDGIHSKLDKMVADQEVQEEEVEQKEYTRKTSTLADALASGNLDEVFNQMKSTVLNNANLSSGPFGMIMSFLPMLKSMFGGDNRKEMGKQAALWGISKINPKIGDYLKRYKEDPAGFFQDMLDQFSVSSNSTVAKLFKPFATKSNILMQENKFDPKALAKFDNKVYMSITKIMPEQLIKQTDLLEAMVTGKVVSPKVYDWEKNDYTTLAESMEKQASDRDTVTTKTSEISTDILDRFQEKIEDNTELRNKYSYMLNLDKDGDIQYDKNRVLDIKNKEAFDEAIASILQSGTSGINQLRGSDTNIDEFIAQNKLDKRLVNGKLVSLTDAELATRKQMYIMLKNMIDTMSPDEITELDQSVHGAKADITKSQNLNFGAWGSLRMSNLFEQVYSGAISPEEYLSKIGIVPRHFGGGGGSGPGSGEIPGSTSTTNTEFGNFQNQEHQTPKLYKNSKGEMVPFSELSDNEKAALRVKALRSDEVYGQVGSETSKLNYMGVNPELDETEQLLLGLLHNGIIDNEQYIYFNTNKDNDEVKAQLAKAKKKFDAASKFYNQLSKYGLTSGKILATNKDIDPQVLKSKGYFNSPGDIYKYIDDDGKVNKEALKNKFNIYNDKNLEDIQKIDIKNLATSGTIVNNDNYVDSTADFLSTLFSDPSLAKKAGIVAGGVAGFGLSKVLQMMGKKPGIVTKSLPVVMATLMTTEYAQRWASNIFGPEGSVKGASGFSNREIFMSKLVTKWLPALGFGIKTAQTTRKLMGLMGPMGYLMGLPVSLAAGTLMGWMGPKLLGGLQEKMFGAEARKKGTALSKLGDTILQTFPWLNKYLGSGTANERMQYLQTFEQSRQKFRELFKETKEKYRNESDPNEKVKLDQKLKVYSDADKILSDGIKRIKSIKDMSADEESMALSDIKRDVDTKIAKLEETEGKNGKEINKYYKETSEKIEADAGFDVGSAVNAKYNTANDFIKTASNEISKEENKDISEDAKNIIKEAKENIDTKGTKYKDFTEVFTSSSVTKDIVDQIKSTRDKYKEAMRFANENSSVSDILGYDRMNTLNDIVNNEELSDDEKTIKFRETLDSMIEEIRNSESESAAADADRLVFLLTSRKTLKEAQDKYLTAIRDALKVSLPGMSEEELINLSTSVYSKSIKANKLDEIYDSFNHIKDTVTGVTNAMGDGYTTEERKEARVEANKFSSIYAGEPAGGASSSDAFTTTYTGQGRTTMESLKGKKFSTGAPLDQVGCSIAAFNNMLRSMGLSQVDPDALIPIAEKYLTSKSTVTPGFFINAALDLNIDPLTYNGKNITDTNLVVFSPARNTRGLVALLSNTDGSSHYVTVTTIKGDTVVYDDPNLNTPVSTTMNTFLSRLEVLIVFNKVSVSSTLKEIYTEVKNDIKDSKVVSAVEDKIKNIPSAAEKLAIGAGKVGLGVGKLGLGTAKFAGKLGLKTAVGVGKLGLGTAKLGGKLALNTAIGAGTLGLGVGKLGVMAGSAGVDYIKDLVGNMSKLRNKVTDELPKTEGREQERSLLNKIYLAISGMRSDMTERADEPTPVSILEDQTIPLQTADEEKAKALNRGMKTSTPAEEAAKSNVKRTLEVPGVKHESEQAEAVQEKILSGEANIAGTKANEDGTKANAKKKEKEEDKSKDKDDSPSKPFSIKNILNSIVGKLGLASGGLLAALPALLTWKIGGRYAKALPKQFLGLFKESKEAEYDPETGAKVKEGHYKDVSGFARNFRNVKTGLFKGTSVLTEKFGSIVSGFGGKIANLGGKTAEKLAQNKNMIDNAGSLVARLGQTFGKSMAVGADKVAKFISTVSDFLYKVMDGLQNKVMKIPFVKKYAEKLLAKLAVVVPKLLTKMGPLGQKVLQKASENIAKGTAKSIPGFNIIVGLGLATNAIWNALVHTDTVLDIPKDTVTFGLRIVAMAAKCIWDILPMIIGIACSYVIPGAALGVDIALSLLQMAIGWKNFLKIFGLDDEWRAGKKLEFVEGKKAEKELEKQAEKQTSEEIKEDEKDTADGQSSFKANVDKMAGQETQTGEKPDDMEKATQEALTATINQEAGTKVSSQEKAAANQVAGANTPSEQATGTSTPIANEGGNSGGSSSRNALLGLLTASGVNTSGLPQTYGMSEEEKEKHRQELMNSPKMKEQMEQWKNSGKDFFHPLGDPNTRITSAFGPRNVKGGSKNHKGVDFSVGGKNGVPIRASKSGKVITTTPNYGQIVIQHPDGTSARYMHLSERFPKLGAEVAAGDVIGTSGGVGKNGAHSYIPHLHYEIIEKNGVKVDPFLKLGLDPKVINTKPAANNRENIAYLERHPFLLEKNKSIEKDIEKDKANEAKSNQKPQEESIKTKAAGGPSEADDLKMLREEAKAKADVAKMQTNAIPSNTALLQVVGMLSQSIQQQQTSLTAINTTLNAILTYLQSNINNDMLESGMIAKMN